MEKQNKSKFREKNKLVLVEDPFYKLVKDFRG